MRLYFTQEQVDSLRQVKAEIEWIHRQGSPDSPSSAHLELIEEHLELAIQEGTRPSGK